MLYVFVLSSSSLFQIDLLTDRENLCFALLPLLFRTMCSAASQSEVFAKGQFRKRSLND
jgi:hypothetical protein